MGVWSFHRPGMNFPNEARAGEPMDWEDGLGLSGADDVSFARWLWETLDLGTLDPAQDVLVSADPQIRAAATADRRRLAIYAPYAGTIRLSEDLTALALRAVDLSTRRVMFLQVNDLARPLPVNADVLLLIESQPRD
jgi:hypothetical protein